MRKVRAKEVAEGEMSPEEARKKRNRARLHNAASVGVAALGIKGAYSEWKEMKERYDEVHEFDLKRRQRHERRLLKQHAHDILKTEPTQSGLATPGLGYGNPYSNASANAYMNSQTQYRSSAPDPASDLNAYHADNFEALPRYSDDSPNSNRSHPPPAYR